MSRALWDALGKAADAVPAAVDEYERAPTPQTRDAMDAALHEYVQRLRPVIGDAEAFRYEASSATYQNATDRVEQLNARLSTLPSMDETDRTRRRRLLEEREVAGKAFEVPLRDRCSFGRFTWLISQALTVTYVVGEHRLYLERNCRLPESGPQETAESRGACQFQGAEQSARVSAQR